MHRSLHQPIVRQLWTSACTNFHAISKMAQMARSRSIPLHLAIPCVVTMADTDESCSSATLYTSDELDNTSSNTDATEDSRNKRKDSHNTRISSRRTAPSAVTIVPKPKRARFEAKRRQQVANVRKKGACLRCRIKKLPVRPVVWFWPEISD